MERTCTSRFAIAAGLVAVVLALPSAAQDNKARQVSSDVAKEATKAFAKEYRSKNRKIRLAAVDRLTKLKHPLVAKALAKALSRDRDPRVRSAAAERLGYQDAKTAKKPLRAAFLAKKNESAPEVMRSILGAYRGLKLSPGMKDISKRFDKWSKEVQREVIITLRYHREVETVMFFTRYINDPKPVAVDSPTNPPASYWKAKLERWTFWIADLQETLWHLTGESFDTASDIRTWRKQGGKILMKSPDEDEGKRD